MQASDETCGGDPPCWAHLFEEADGADEPGGANLAAIALDAVGRGPAWTLRSQDLDVNLLVFAAGEGVAEHANDEVDVLLVGVAGEGSVTVEGRSHRLEAGYAVLVPKGTRRSTRAGSARFAYLTCHRRRAGLQPMVRAERTRDRARD
jgi:mannose-6-phosphate isomerase-like protein (cupin superfamily)